MSVEISYQLDPASGMRIVRVDGIDLAAIEKSQLGDEIGQRFDEFLDACENNGVARFRTPIPGLNNGASFLIKRQPGMNAMTLR